MFFFKNLHDLKSISEICRNAGISNAGFAGTVSQIDLRILPIPVMTIGMKIVQILPIDVETAI